MTKSSGHCFTHHTPGHEGETTEISEGSFLGCFPRVLRAILHFTDVSGVVSVVLESGAFESSLQEIEGTERW